MTQYKGRTTYEVEIAVRQRATSKTRPVGSIIGKSGHGILLVTADLGIRLGAKKRNEIAEKIKKAARRIVEKELEREAGR